MCINCWQEHGSPVHTSPAIEQAAELIRGIYETEPVGSPLHAELDDWNIEGSWKPYRDREDLDDPGAWDLAVELCVVMNGMPVRDRAAALYRAEGMPWQEKEGM